jgi:hypothetical protein
MWLYGGRTCGSDGKELGIEEYAFFVRGRHPLFMVWPPGQSVSLVHSSWFVYYGEVELGEEK